jgi:hypothetical protein
LPLLPWNTSTHSAYHSCEVSLISGRRKKERKKEKKKERKKEEEE